MEQPHACPCHLERTDKMVPMSGNNHDCLPFLLIPSPQTQVVWGSTRSTHANNPHRDWALGRVLGSSTHCLMKLLTGASLSSPMSQPNIWTFMRCSVRVEAFLYQLITSMSVPSTYSQGPCFPPGVCSPYQAAADFLPSSISIRREQQMWPTRSH